MKTFLIALLLALSTSAFADARSDRIAAFTELMQAEAKKHGVGRIIVEDTGQSADLGDGEGPLVTYTLPAVGVQCLVALHPTQDGLMAELGCIRIEKTVEG